MNDIRRTVLWVVFASSLLFLWDAWNRYNGHPSMFAPTPARTAAAGSAPASGAASLPAPAATGTAAVAANAAASAPAAAPAPAAQLVTVTTDLVKATINSNGGGIERLELLKVQSDEGQGNMVLLDHSAEHVELVQSGLVAGGAAPPNHTTPMTVLPGERTLKDGANELQLVLESPEVGGIKLVKTYTFKRGDYAIGVKNEVVNTSTAPVSPSLYLRLVRDGQTKKGPAFTGAFTGPALYDESAKFQKLTFEDIDKNKLEYDKSADNGWIAMVQHYFVAGWIVNDKQAREFSVDKLAGSQPPQYAVTMVLPLGSIAPGAHKAQDATLYAGPTEEARLKGLAPGFDLVRDYGRLKVLGEPLFWLLSKLHALLGNWGWAIVGLVVLLKIAFYRLNSSQFRSMAKMKALNPRIQELRERLKDKPQQMQQEMMAIYREEKVNPLGGCLPILVQMPVFIALYSVLLSSAEMRHAPWIGWITDLSAKDPYYILPVIYTATSLLQVWLSPTPADPAQAKMMWIMPLVFSVMFFQFPAGLVLYWVTNGVLQIAQQWLINKQLGVTNK
jgi:YidC/Oxa1 family membrane protein insertase